MKNLTILIVVAALCLKFDLKAQNHITKKSLNIGDDIPSELWKEPFKLFNNSTTDTITLSSYRNKLIILDFWATWCSSCIKNFPRLDSLNGQNSTQIILVNSKNSGDNPERIKYLFSKLEKSRGTPFSFPVIYGDTLLESLFPHNILPHYVWIYNGKVLATTDSYEITVPNIISILKHPKSSLILKEDKLNFDYKESFRKNLGVNIDSILVTTSLFSNFIPGLVSGKNIIINDHQKRYYFTNRPVLSLYQFAFDRSFNQIIIELKNNRKLETSPKTLGIADDQMDGYRKKNLFCYELIVPLHQKTKDDLSKMLTDLNQFFHLRGRVEKRKIKCFVIKKKDHQTIREAFKSFKTWKPSNNFYSGVVEVHSIKELVYMLNYYTDFKMGQPIVLDETKLAGTRKMLIPASGMSNPDLLSKVLDTYGFTITQQSRSIEMCVISE